MRPLSTVNPHVSGQVTGICERLLTQVALIRLLSTVNPHVPGQVTELYK